MVIVGDRWALPICPHCNRTYAVAISYSKSGKNAVRKAQTLPRVTGAARPSGGAGYGEA